jgi:hypothetical protein
MKIKYLGVLIIVLLAGCMEKSAMKKWEEKCNNKDICYIYSSHSVFPYKGEKRDSYHHFVYSSLRKSAIKELLITAKGYADTVQYDHPMSGIDYFNSFEGISSFPAYPNYINEQIAFKNKFARVVFYVKPMPNGEYSYSLYRFLPIVDGKVVKDLELDSLKIVELIDE